MSDPSHVASWKTYLAVFLALAVLTGVTVLAASHDFGAFNTPIALAIAATKATLVAVFFMHLRGSGKRVVLVVATAVVWLALLIGQTLIDYQSRSWPIGGEPPPPAPVADLPPPGAASPTAP